MRHLKIAAAVAALAFPPVIELFSPPPPRGCVIKTVGGVSVD